jgi:arabinogalactan endo-1,4-beta-galactosidase
MLLPTVSTFVKGADVGWFQMEATGYKFYDDDFKRTALQLLKDEG